MNKTKSYDELTIRDHFMFGKICSKPENRKLILDSLLLMDLKENTGEIEKHIQIYRDAKFAKLDLLVEDIFNKIYNTEMQNESKNPTRQKELPKRSRYYQSILDSSHLSSGEPYSELPETFIIFICTFDPFKKNLPIYTFESQCFEDPSVEYNDYTHKIFFNTTADLSSLPQAQRNMLEYINSGIANDCATQAIDYEVNEARLSEEWRNEYMLTLTYRDEIFAEAKEEGLEEGRAEGREEGRAEGREEGRAEGREEGRAEGRAESQAEIDRLKSLLLTHGINPNE